jgi:K+-sensing histidine kinase KdpD
MKIGLLLVAGKNKRFAAVAIDAANAAFPGASVAHAGSLDEAIGMAASEPEVLVLAPADEATIARAVQVLDGDKLPRWAVVAMGEAAAAPFTEVVPDAQWNTAVVARAFRSALALRLLRRETERLRGDLLAVGVRITHDLRTPLGGVLSAAEALEASAHAKPENGFLPLIFESADELARIITQLTLVAKASGKPVTPQTFNMGDPVSRALERVQLKAREREATISKPKSWPDAVGDPSYSEAVWAALLENAIRHSGKSPQIELGWEECGEACRFWVHDQGSGVAPQKRRQLFHPFHRLHEPSAARGLGLPIAERLVRLQGGECGYLPRAPSGSSFYFTLPR